MHSQVVSLRLGLNVSCCRELRDSRPSVSRLKRASRAKVVSPFRFIASKIVASERRLPVSSKLEADSVKQLRVSTAVSGLEAESVIFKETWSASGAVDSLQRRCLAILPSWVSEFRPTGISLVLVISIVTSSLYLYTPPAANAVGFFTPKEARNQDTVRSNTNEVQDNEAFRARISLAIDLLEKGQNAQAQGDYGKALRLYEEVKQTAGDLALAEYARVGHAVTAYEVGDRNEAITEMEDVSIALRGYPEIHAALAAALYVDKHAPLPAEKQFNIATLLDPRYTNLKWVEENRHWPPSLINSLKRFITLQ
ncbi:hypothetical protein R1flu_013464 [Riccia fluitans]|uniref:Uncharacterized protein n=1 Tax=Riccia fluitans TaxID=41844 RepID=A0ABD1YDM5_9MARC